MIVPQDHAQSVAIKARPAPKASTIAAKRQMRGRYF
jgi:hypothetical protein